MKHIRIIFFLLVSLFISSVCNAAVDNIANAYTKEQTDSIVNLKVQRQVDTMLIGLKIDKIANEKFESIQAKHDELVSQHLTLLGVMFTILAAIIGIIIPLVMNRRVESKMEENAKVMDNYNKQLVESRLELERGKRNLNELESAIKGLHEQMKLLEQNTQVSMNKAEKAARESKFSEFLARVWNENDYGKRIELVTQLIDDYPDDDFASKAYFARGTIYFMNKCYKEAVDDFTTAIKRNPDNASLLCSRGDAYCKWCQWDNAIEDYTQSIKINSQYAEAYYGRGKSYINTNKAIDKAIEDLKKAIELKPDIIEAYYWLGVVYEKEENYMQSFDILMEGNRKAKIKGDLTWESRIKKELNYVRKKTEKKRMDEYQTESDRLFSHAVDQLTQK